MVKPARTRLSQIYAAPMHKKSKSVGANLSAELRSQYGRRSVRVRKGDSIKILRGEYKGVEGKINKVHTEEGRLEIEGVHREKVKGGKTPVLIHASNIVVVALNLDDKWRQSVLQGKEGKE